MNDADTLLARAQVWLAVLFAIGFFAILFLLMLKHNDMSTTEVTILTGLTSVLATLLTLQMNFFYARQRPAALPDPTLTTTTTTTPAPTVTTTQTPASTEAGQTLKQS